MLIIGRKVKQGVCFGEQSGLVITSMQYADKGIAVATLWPKSINEKETSERAALSPLPQISLKLNTPVQLVVDGMQVSVFVQHIKPSHVSLNFSAPIELPIVRIELLSRSQLSAGVPEQFWPGNDEL